MIDVWILALLIKKIIFQVRIVRFLAYQETDSFCNPQ